VSEARSEPRPGERARASEALVSSLSSFVRASEVSLLPVTS
jgi:hypothetical protein